MRRCLCMWVWLGRGIRCLVSVDFFSFTYPFSRRSHGDTAQDRSSQSGCSIILSPTGGIDLLYCGGHLGSILISSTTPGSLLNNITYFGWIVYMLVIVTQTRFYYRKLYHIPATTCVCCEGRMEDFCCGYWCGCCTTIQMARHTHESHFKLLSLKHSQ